MSVLDLYIDLYYSKYFYYSYNIDHFCPTIGLVCGVFGGFWQKIEIKFHEKYLFKVLYCHICDMPFFF
jgi:hypothetical protein